MQKRKRTTAEALLHFWRLLTEPSGRGRLRGMVGGWQVVYPDGAKTEALAYDVACDYAAIFGGEVRRYRREA